MQTGRATSVMELAGKMGGIAPSAQQVADYRPLEPRPTDVVITPFGKCGTTMMQQMFHQLRTAAQGGDMDFDDISRVTPWIEMSILLPDVDINAEQKAQPRGFKSHLHYEGLPPGMRYVVTLRDPGEAYMSMYHFFEGWLFEPGTIKPEEFMPVWMRGGPSRVDYFDHLLSWWKRRDSADSLVWSYRGVIANKREAIAKLARFCGIAADEAAIDLVERRTSRAFMLEHKAPFADLLMREMMTANLGLPLDSDSAKVRGEDEPRLPLPDAISEEIDALWHERIAPVTGHSDFRSLAASLDI